MAAEGVTDDSRLVSASDDHTADARLPTVATTSVSGGSKRRSGTPHSLRFLAVTAALVGIAIGAIGVAVAILVGDHSPGPQPKWSTFTPQDPGVGGERDIANYVAPLYRAAPSTQLAVVTVQNYSDTGTGTQVALRNANDGTLSALSGTTAVFNLCGLGPNCAIAGGTPSTDRLLLLRREALELSLYTFRYVHNVDNVVSILPPGRTQAVTTAKLTARPPDKAGSKSKGATLYMAVAFQRRSLQPFLNRPLTETLPEQIPPTPTTIGQAPEAELVSVLTAQALFQQKVIQAQDGSNVLVLDQLPPQ